MDNISNMIHTNQSKTGGHRFSVDSNPKQEGHTSAESADSSSRATSFDESLKKASDKSTDKSSQGEDKSDIETDGKKLPLAAESSKLAEQDDRTASSAGSDTTASTSLESKLPAQDSGVKRDELPASEMDSQELATQPPAEEVDVLVTTAGDNADIDSKVGILLSQVRQQLRTEQSTSGINSQSNQSRTASGEYKKTDSLIATSDGLPLSTQQADLMAGKNNVLSSTLTQQTVSNIQSSLLLDNVSTQGESVHDSSPLVANTLTSSLLSTTLATSLSSIPQAEITEPFGRPAWSQGMGKQILWMVNQNINRAEIRLNPAHLGPIEILIDMSDDQVNVSLSSRHANVREAMEQALPKLREMLSENGFSLADTDISQHSFAEQREQNTEKANNGINRNHSKQSTDSAMSGQITPLSTSQPVGLVDYYI